MNKKLVLTGALMIATGEVIIKNDCPELLIDLGHIPKTNNMACIAKEQNAEIPEVHSHVSLFYPVANNLVASGTSLVSVSGTQVLGTIQK